MVEIKIINNKDEWNNTLKKTINYNIFSTFEWGEYKKDTWKVERLAFYKSGNFLGQCQFLIKKRFIFIVSWNSGGINLVNYKYLESIVKVVKEYFKDNYFNLRFNFYDIKNGENLFEISQILQPANKTLNSGFSLLHYLGDCDDFIKIMSSNHRYYYKKASKNNFKIRYSSKESINDFILLHNEMTTSKELNHLRINKEVIVNLSNEFSDNFLIFSIYLDENIISSCLILTYQDQAFYYLAASNEVGRKTYSSYFMIKELFEYLKNKGISKFDFAGITPYDKSAQGVNKFKIGFGGELVNYMGEWEMTNSRIVSYLINNVYLR